ncbi:hypothetical protein ACIBSW_13100 [Actinoplanes sp. NPDC049668]|uniref:hypothetical protein n=1 Tax=unclassified Actinoplanes TaxID=2626549 RepID=UPI0033A15F72
MTTEPSDAQEMTALRPPAEPRPDRSLIASIAASASWASTPDFAARTAPARQAFAGRFERQIREAFPDLDDAQVAIRAEHAKKAYYLRLALKSAQVRRAKAARKSGA